MRYRRLIRIGLTLFAATAIASAQEQGSQITIGTN